MEHVPLRELLHIEIDIALDVLLTINFVFGVSAGNIRFMIDDKQYGDVAYVKYLISIQNILEDCVNSGIRIKIANRLTRVYLEKMTRCYVSLSPCGDAAACHFPRFMATLLNLITDGPSTLFQTARAHFATNYMSKLIARQCLPRHFYARIFNERHLVLFPPHNRSIFRVIDLSLFVDCSSARHMLLSHGSAPTLMDFINFYFPLMFDPRDRHGDHISRLQRYHTCALAPGQRRRRINVAQLHGMGLKRERTKP